MATGEVNMYRRFAVLDRLGIVRTVDGSLGGHMVQCGFAGYGSVRTVTNTYAINTFGTHESGYGSMRDIGLSR